MTRIERAAPALCQYDNLLENIKLEGRPTWERYIGETEAALAAFDEPDERNDTSGARDDSQITYLIATSSLPW